MKADLGLAIKIASEVFVNKKDKGGNPYILHCLRVMNGVSSYGEEVQIIAVLHDVPEDTDVCINTLRAYGFSERILTALDLLHHREKDPYEDYIKKLAFNADAKAVKIEDLKDNSNITRLKGLRKKDFDRLEKYHKAYVYLQD